MLSLSETVNMARLAGELAPAHLVRGGSWGTPLQTPTSDLDFFLISDSAESAELARTLGRVIPDVPMDLETMTIVKFESLMDELEEFRATVDGGYSPFDGRDLRFLGRAVLGDPIICNSEIAERLKRNRDQIRIASANYWSSMLIMKYQDAYGLFEAARYSDLLVVAGELAQIACLVSVLQTELIDLAPKWGPRSASESDHQLVVDVSSRLRSHLGDGFLSDNRGWAERFLALVNGTVAAGCLVSAGLSCNTGPTGPMHSAGRNLSDCIMGVPGYLTIATTDTNQICVCNESYLVDAVTRCF